MVKEVFVPALGMAMEECILLEWLKQPGDGVDAGEDVVVIETDKATMELEAPVAGRLGPHRFPAGATVPVGEIVSYVLEGDEDESALPAGVGVAAPGDAAAATPVDGERAAASPDTADGASPASSTAAEPDVSAESRATSSPAHHTDQGDARTPHTLSPRQRRLAAERAGREPAEVPDRYRAAVTEAVAESWRTIPHFGVTSHVRAEVLVGSVAQVRAALPQVTVTDLLLRAFALALAEQGRGGGMLGLAVATERGVSIPVLANLAGLSLGDVAAARADAVERARAARMSEVDGTSPEFSLSNLGGYDVEYFTGIIPVRQQGLLTVGKVAQRPVVLEGVLAAINTFYATLNVDHRTLDGVHAAAILDGFAAIANDPARLIGRSPEGR